MILETTPSVTVVRYTREGLVKREVAVVVMIVGPVGYLVMEVKEEVKKISSTVNVTGSVRVMTELKKTFCVLVCIWVTSTVVESKQVDVSIFHLVTV